MSTTEQGDVMSPQVSGGLPEGAQPLVDEQTKVPVAQTIAVGVGSPKVPNFVAREPINVLLPDGRKVGMALPKVALSQFISRILKDDEFADAKLMGQEQLRVKSLLFVSDIDGEPVDRPQDKLACLKLEQDLGDDGCDLVFLAFMQSFRPMDSSQLVITKKS